MLTNIPEALGAEVVLIYAAICTFINVAAKFLLQPYYFPTLSPLSPADLKALHLRLVGALNSIVITALSAIWFIPRVSVAEHGVLLIPVGGQSLDLIQSRAFQLMMGFLLYDCFADCYVNGLTVDMGLHHITGSVSNILILLTGRGGEWMMWIMLAEGSTPFLHIGWILHKLGYDGLWYKVNGYTLVLTFTLLRAISPLFILNSMITHRTLPVWTGYESCFNLHLIITAFFTLLNWFWYVKLLKMAGLLPEGKKKGGKAN
jgi:hypothetical protein